MDIEEYLRGWQNMMKTVGKASLNGFRFFQSTEIKVWVKKS